MGLFSSNPEQRQLNRERRLAMQFRHRYWSRRKNGDVFVRVVNNNRQSAHTTIPANMPMEQVPENIRYIVREARSGKSIIQ